MSNETTEGSNALVNIISTAIQVPGVKVDRESFLLDVFKKKSPEIRNRIIEVGPVKAGCSRKELKQIADKLVLERTLISSGTSFVAGLPGGLVMAATIPADLLQFYGVALRLAQEIAYLYGGEDLWDDDSLDMEKVTNQLILYCGVMFGVSSTAQALKILSSSMAKQALKKIPQMTLMKTIYYPVIKSICKAVGVKMTKEVFAKGVAKAIPIVGGVASGSITLLTMRPMGMRLVNTLDDAHFAYSEAEFQADWRDITEDLGVDESEPSSDSGSASQKGNSVIDEIQKAKALYDSGVITEQEFESMKANLIAKM